jgi:hypothetical protein
VFGADIAPFEGLGLVSAPLYLFEPFFAGKAAEHLLGEGIRSMATTVDRMTRPYRSTVEVVELI